MVSLWAYRCGVTGGRSEWCGLGQTGVVWSDCRHSNVMWSLDTSLWCGWGQIGVVWRGHMYAVWRGTHVCGVTGGTLMLCCWGLIIVV